MTETKNYLPRFVDWNETMKYAVERINELADTTDGLERDMFTITSGTSTATGKANECGMYIDVALKDCMGTTYCNFTSALCVRKDPVFTLRHYDENGNYVYEEKDEFQNVIPPDSRELYFKEVDNLIERIKETI